MTCWVRTDDGTVLGNIWLGDADGKLTGSTPVLQQICDRETEHWGDPVVAYRWLARGGNGYLVVTEE